MLGSLHARRLPRKVACTNNDCAVATHKFKKDSHEHMKVEAHKSSPSLRTNHKDNYRGKLKVAPTKTKTQTLPTEVRVALVLVLVLVWVKAVPGVPVALGVLVDKAVKAATRWP